MYQFLSPPSLQKMSANTGTPERAWGFSPPPHTPEGVSGEGSTLALKPFLGWRPHTISVQKAPSPTLGVCFSRQQVVNHSRSLWLLWKVMLSCQGPRQSSFVIQKWMEEACSHILRTETSVGGKRRLSLTLASAVPVSADWHPVIPTGKARRLLLYRLGLLHPIPRSPASTQHTHLRGETVATCDLAVTAPSAPQQSAFTTERGEWVCSQLRHRLTLRPAASLLPASPCKIQESDGLEGSPPSFSPRVSKTWGSEGTWTK